ncbi:polysaccharide deacetylase family protein [Bacillus sp. H-16]|uniref:polysaccharide deacetylase family protein n=1 Tax=Alteribacter salitolerans TaxID=2912333 RepID=UPI001964F8D1|nr:polysaccharide deacetylase family protein [Alteribacter salitolerans]MBM7096335.1 polysaccharide deacetylase family protein [Alteribacter salitolerans]
MKKGIVAVSFLLVGLTVGIYFFNEYERHFVIHDHKQRSFTPLFYSSPETENVDRVEEVRDHYRNVSLSSPLEWGENVSGVKNRLDTDEDVIALTFDACGGPFGSSYDHSLITFLREHEIPATLFINLRWIDENEEIFLELAEDPLFRIENHGSEHLPLSVNGNGAWGINGTASPEEVIDEVMLNQERILEMTGQAPRYFRSGTAHYDEKAVEIVENLGLTVVNYDVLGDAGATFSASGVEEALLSSRAGSIPLLHMNQPSSGTAEGVKQAVPQLQEAGITFVHLDQYELSE